ncbi:hypothetical protein AQ616_04680 [Oceanobacillus sp. E9]|uniref:alpha/beta hydrolase family protein n=1 Tax=Oceanobacillus TaxID=182709 RepID=UPI00084E7B3F|nr:MULTISPECIES: alpha/beta hydrolase family protein [Oceanobacillus]OEH55477.1 hypothetical protein AQ616_04680 [Oceanobacillus sp. E9]
MNRVNRFLNQQYNNTTHSISGGNQQEDIKDCVKEALGSFQNENNEFNPKIMEKRKMKNYKLICVEIMSIYPLRIPFYILIPNKKKRKLPVVLALHGHGHGMKEAIGLNTDNVDSDFTGIHNKFAAKIVQMGVIVVVPGIIGFGDRRLEEDMNAVPPCENSCFKIASQLLLMGKTIAGLRVHELIRVLDYIQTIKMVDQEKIGCFGFSGGGLIAAFTSILDERIKATVLSGYLSTFNGSIMHRRHCLDNYIPGILKIGEMDELISSIAPRPLFIESGKEDQLFPLHQVEIAMKNLLEIYKGKGAESELEYHYFNGGHEINGEKSFYWLIQKLLYN